MNMPERATVERVIRDALAEDIGSGDVTTQLLVPEDLQGTMEFNAREKLVVAGGEVAVEVFHAVNPQVKVTRTLADGAHATEGLTLLVANGPARALLTAERTALNLMQRMCGVATLTHAYVEAVAGTKAKILDTRKTMPGLRALDKYAVTCGGGVNHRFGLYDAVLVKDNHIGIGDWGLGIREVVKTIREKLALMPNPQSLIPIIVECDTLAQVEQAVEAAPHRILLDNMSLDMLREAVKITGGKVPLEASGGVTLETVRKIAETGVDYISVGAVTHSARAVDIGADMRLTA